MLFKRGLRLFKGLCLLFLPNVPEPMFIQGGTFIPDYRVLIFNEKFKFLVQNYGLLTTMQEPPFRQSAGVATFLTAVNCNESITLKTSSKFRPVVAGYKIDNLSFLSGPMIKTARQVNGIPIFIKKL